MTVDLSTGGLPKYHRVANRLRQMIREGQFKPGEKIPSESQLVAQFQVSHLTIRHAIGVLRTEGLLVAEQGRGVFVKEQPRLRRISRNRYGRARSDKQLLTSSLTHKITFAGEITVPDEIADLMEVERGTTVFVRRRTLYDDAGRAAEMGASYLKTEVAQGELREPETVSKALFLIVEDITGKRYTWAADLLIARMPTVEEAETLNIGPGTPVLHVRHTAHAEDGEVLEVSESVWPADRSMLYDEYQIPQEPAEPETRSDI
jgi:DNA-binding GntR family transcriptional regulator